MQLNIRRETFQDFEVQKRQDIYGGAGLNETDQQRNQISLILHLHQMWTFSHVIWPMNQNFYIVPNPRLVYSFLDLINVIIIHIKDDIGITHLWYLDTWYGSIIMKILIQ